MRILILATDIYTRGGIARYTATLAQALSALPASVDVLPLLGPTAIPVTAGIHSGYSRGLAVVAMDSRFRGTDDWESCILTPTADRLSAIAKVRHAIRAYGRAKSRYDLVICSHVGQAPLAAFIQQRYRTPYMVVAHGWEAWVRLPIVKRLAIRRAHTLLAVSVYTARKLAPSNGIPAERVKVVYNAIPDEMVYLLTGLAHKYERAHAPGGGVAAALRGASRVLLSVANLAHSYKGVDTVIRALPRILASVPGLRYVVAGGGEDRPRLEDLASSLGVRDRVIFAGEVSDTDLVNLYRACDVFVLPSRSGRGAWSSAPMQGEDRARIGRSEVPAGEGFGRVYVEAALAGKPVVGSIDAGAAEAVLHGRTGVLVDPRSVAEVAGAVIDLLKSPGWAASLGAEGRRWAMEKFTVDSMRRSLKACLASVVSCPSSVVRCGMAPAPHL